MTPPEEKPRRLLWGIIGILVGGLIAALLTAVVVTAQIRSAQVTNTAKGDSRDQALEIVKDCVQVGGECYERGQKQTADILSSAQRIIILSAACSASVSPDQAVDQRIAAITNCVNERLTRSKR